MKDVSITPLAEINTLLIHLEGRIDPDQFISTYDTVLSHPSFKANTHLIWDATRASIKDISLAELKTLFSHVRDSEHIRGRSCSAWIFARGENYETACLFKAAFGPALKIRYEVFSNLSEAKNWIQSFESLGFGATKII